MNGIFLSETNQTTYKIKGNNKHKVTAPKKVTMMMMMLLSGVAPVSAVTVETTINEKQRRRQGNITHHVIRPFIGTRRNVGTGTKIKTKNRAT